MSDPFDLFEDPDGRAPAADNAPEFTVSEISGAVKRVIEGGFARIRVRGEVSRVSRPRSGHVYFDLKDDRSVLAGVVWKGQAARLQTQPEEGLEVVATGRLTTFPGQSKYQMVIDSLAPAGVGALMAMLEKRRKALEAEGLFDPDRKRPLPYLPGVIGVVTSPSGAVIRDILHRLRDRFPSRVLLWPETRIDTSYIDGPFRHLESRWDFRPMDGGCEVAFRVDFEFRNRLLQGAAGLFFNEAMLRIVSAFEARARALYG